MGIIVLIRMRCNGIYGHGKFCQGGRVSFLPEKGVPCPTEIHQPLSNQLGSALLSLLPPLITLLDKGCLFVDRPWRGDGR